MADDLPKLKEDALKALESGRHRRGAELCLKVARRDADPSWSHRAGEALHRLGANGEAVHPLTAAADGYARQGYLLKAIAVCKLILEIDKTHSRTQDLLASLYAQRLVPTRSPSGLDDTAGPARRPAVELRSGGDAPVADPAPPKPSTIPLEVEDITFALPCAEGEGEGRGAFAKETDSASRVTVPGKRQARQAPLMGDDESLGSVHLREVPGTHDSSEFPAVEIPLESLDAKLPPSPAAPSLPSIPLFSALGEAPLRRLIDRVIRVVAPAGRVIVRQGDVGSSLFVIVGGSVAVTVTSGESSQTVGQLGEGDFFGELAVLTMYRRSATVTAVTNTELLSIDRKVIADLIRETPALLRVLLRFFRDRMIGQLIATSDLFRMLSPEEAKGLAGRFRFLEFEPGASLIQQGKPSPGLLILLGGSCDVTRRRAGLDDPLATVGPGELIGEMSLLDDVPATATVRANTRTWALALPRATFQEVMQAHPQILGYVRGVASQRRQPITKRLV